MLKTGRIAAAMLLVCALARPALGWHQAGHEMVAAVAFANLPDAQKQAAIALLKVHPHYAEFFAAVPDSVPSADRDAYMFAKAATWPDWVRKDLKLLKPAEITAYSSPVWHYVDIPYIKPGDEGLFDIAKLEPATQPAVGKEDILQAMRAMVAILKGKEGELQGPEASVAEQVSHVVDKDEKVPAADKAQAKRAVALCWLLHLVGDLHQPLHATSMYSKVYDSTSAAAHGDNGGNLQMVRSGDQVENLHFYWDGLFDLAQDDPEQSTHDALALMARPDLAKDKLTELASDTSPPSFHAWAKESFEVAKKSVYLDGALPSLSAAEYKDSGNDKTKVPELPAGYHDAAMVVAQHRVVLGGYRLEALLEGALK